jgi:mannose/fructose-specific phosphotransferase system component IIA
MIETNKTVETICSVHSLEAGDMAQELEDIQEIATEGVQVQATAIIDLHEKSEVLALVDTCVVTPSNVVAASDVEITQTIL